MIDPKECFKVKEIPKKALEKFIEFTEAVQAASFDGAILAPLFCYRSVSHQQKIYDQGRTAPGFIVTNAKPGLSFHNYGLAVDFALWSEKNRGTGYCSPPQPNKHPCWEWLGRCADELGLEWGGHFKRPDRPHVQLTFGVSIDSYKKAFDYEGWDGIYRLIAVNN